MRWHITPSQVDDAGKVAGGIAVFAGFVTAAWKAIIRDRWQAWQARRAAAKAAVLKAQADALIEAQRRAAVIVAQETMEKLEAAYRLGQEHLLESLSAIREQTEGLHVWKGEHTISDEQQFRELKVGQARTHDDLRDLKGAVSDMDRRLDTTDHNIAEINGSLKVIIQERRR
jgi:hypothetical protein